MQAVLEEQLWHRFSIFSEHRVEDIDIVHLLVCGTNCSNCFVSYLDFISQIPPFDAWLNCNEGDPGRWQFLPNNTDKLLKICGYDFSRFAT